MKIVLELTDGRKITGCAPDTLHTADKTKMISLAFDTGEIYSGFVSDVDSDDLIHLTKPGLVVGCALPLHRLVAWFYKEV